MKKKVKIVFSILLCCNLYCFLCSQDLKTSKSQKIIYTEKQKKMRITASDIKLVPEKKLASKGYHLYIRKKPGIESVMLTETAKDPEGKNDSFAYRARDFNEVNGNEIRYLDGKPLVSEWAKYSLIDSTPEPHKIFDQAFHIYIPEVLDFGYEWERHGTVTIGPGTFINIRTFEKKYADYSGDYMDSPFMFDFVVIPEKKKSEPVILTDDYSPVASSKFQEISETMIYSKGPETIIDDIKGLLKGLDKEKQNDVLFAIDATGSMKNDIDKLKKDLVPSLLEDFAGKDNVRFGLLFYRDYSDSFRYRELPVKIYDFTTELQTFNSNLNALSIKGKEGGDVPEAVYEAVYAAVNFFSWRDSSFRTVILIGDAEPHPVPRNTKKYSKEYVMSEVHSAGIHLQAVLLPEE
ncbi:MAG: VWA domain-containing protein [Treponema sp.]|nr:VWA domain-containing protein [Treponema sp.]